MVNIDSFPKDIKFNGDHYQIHMGVTFKGKLNISYKNMSPGDKIIKNKKDFYILSQVVEPDMKNTHDNYCLDDVTKIVDAPTAEIAFNILSFRLEVAIENKYVEVLKY